MEREIVVRGTGEARALPDQASLKVEVTADRKTQDEAYDARTKLAAGVDGVLERHASAIDRTTIASLVVRPTVQVDVEVGFAILDVAGQYDVDSN